MEIHQRRMGLRTRRKDGFDEPIEERYERFINIIQNDEEYKESMIGADVLATASQRYFEVSIMLRLGIPPPEWQAMSLCDRAELITVHRLNNMVEVLERHISEQNRKMREIQKKSKPLEGIMKRNGQM